MDRTDVRRRDRDTRLEGVLESTFYMVLDQNPTSQVTSTFKSKASKYRRPVRIGCCYILIPSILPSIYVWCVFRLAPYVWGGPYLFFFGGEIHFIKGPESIYIHFWNQLWMISFLTGSPNVAIRPRSRTGDIRVIRRVCRRAGGEPAAQGQSSM